MKKYKAYCRNGFFVGGQMISATGRGFTLIELLVVIAIIGIISGMVLTSVTSTRARARDAKRISDLQQIQTALELYRSDYNGRVPASKPPGCPGGNCTSNAGSSWIPDLVPTYMSAVPRDPSDGPNQRYRYSAVTLTNPIEYELDANMEHLSSAALEINDGGNCNTGAQARYETGSRLDLLPCTP